jgi:hypothetical protein
MVPVACCVYCVEMGLDCEMSGSQTPPICAAAKGAMKERVERRDWKEGILFVQMSDCANSERLKIDNVF